MQGKGIMKVTLGVFTMSCNWYLDETGDSDDFLLSRASSDI